MLTLSILTALIPSLSMANEMLRIAGMGGARIATSAEDAGIFGNPASLVGVKHHNLAFGAAAEDIRWTELPKQGTVQFAAEANINISPAFYYSHAFGKWGASAGYAARFKNFADITLESTEAGYHRNSRQFSATTDLFTRYDLLQEGSWTIGFSRALGKSAAGLRLKLLRQTVNRGTTVSTLNLEARHGPEVDVDVPEELIEAIVAELQFGDRVRDIVHERQPTLERTVNRLELDIGFQRPIWFNPKQTHPPLLVGVLFENLLRADLVEPHPFRIGIGVAYEPLEGLTIAADLLHAVEQLPIGYAVGTEFYEAWKSDHSVAFRMGLRRIETPTHFTIGIAFMLGTFSAEYTLSRPLTPPAIQEAHHLLGLTLRL